MQCKGRDLNHVHKFLQTRNATQLHRLRERSTRPQRTARNTEIDIVMQRANATNSLSFEFRNRTFFVPFEMQPFGWNLFQMNFHSRNLSEFMN